MTDSDANSADIKKLTKRKKETGELYARRPEAELQIGKVLSLKQAQIFEFLKNSERHSADYLLDETIVHLLREQPAGSSEMLETLYAELNRRIWKLLKKFYRNFNNPADFEDFGQKIELAIIKKIFDTNSDSADYAQVNFGDFVVKTAKVVWRGELVKIEREKEIFYAERVGDDENDVNQLENRASDDALTDYTMMLREGLAKLPPHIMIVSELLLDGWQIESKDAREPTISKKLGVSSRTIRNWLKEARALLADYNSGVRK